MNKYLTRVAVVFSTAICISLNSLQLSAFTGGEHWDYQAAAEGVSPSGTLPILYINTENGTVIDQKETYVPATYWLDASADPDQSSIGSADNMLPLGIRGRGNSSWVDCDKKPYKIKLEKKQEILGMGKNKHWALLAYVGGYTSYFAHPLAFKIGSYIIKSWTPTLRPVEVVLNGQYIGFYFLAETVRIDSARLDISEQPEGNTDPMTIDGGYLVEIDNYHDVNQIELVETEGVPLLVTAKTPEPFNQLQQEYLTEQFSSMNAAIYNPDKLSREWEEFIDMDSYARHFVVEEIMNNLDAYSGSCYLHKEYGQKWAFGPLWDAGDSFVSKTDFTYNATTFRTTWIRQMVQYPRFIKKVQEVWDEFKAIDSKIWYDFLDEFDNKISEAEQQNQKVWDYYRGSTTTSRKKVAVSTLADNISWLDSRWGAGPLTYNVSVTVTGAGHATLGGHNYTDVDVFAGTSVDIAVTPDDGYCISSVKVDGVDTPLADNNTLLTIPSVNQDVHVNIVFNSISSVMGVEAPTTTWSINDGTVRCNTHAIVYNTLGAVVGEGNSIELPAHGIYIIKTTMGAERIKY